MLCRIAGSVYDVLGHIYPLMMGHPHDGMMFSTPWNDNDLATITNCASYLGGGWWYSACSLWSPTNVNPVWLSLPDAIWYSMERVHIMVKPQ